MLRLFTFTFLRLLHVWQLYVIHLVPAYGRDRRVLAVVPHLLYLLEIGLNFFKKPDCRRYSANCEENCVDEIGTEGWDQHA